MYMNAVRKKYARFFHFAVSPLTSNCPVQKRCLTFGQAAV